MKISTVLFSAFAVLLFVSNGLAADRSGAAIVLHPWYSTATVDTGTSTTSSTVFINPELNYTFSSGLMLGLQYQYETSTVASTTDTATGYGASIGYTSDGWLLSGTYMASSTIERTGIKRSNGTGFWIEAGREWMFGNKFFGGVVVEYKSMSYPKLVSSGVESTVTYKTSSISPGFRLGFMF